VVHSTTISCARCIRQPHPQQRLRLRNGATSRDLGAADAIAFGRLLLANPDLVERFAAVRRSIP
jgi:hypothetical protein